MLSLLRTRPSWLVLALGAAASLAAPAAAQAPRVQDEVFVGGEIERYLRVLQVAGKSPLHPWSIRGLSPAEVERQLRIDSEHPWAWRQDLSLDVGDGPRWGWVQPEVGIVYNPRFPYGSNDGAVWAGRGFTTALRAGVSARYGPVSLVLAPEAFWTQNAHFDLAPNGQNGPLAYGDPVWHANIDLPQRFGDEPYARVDPGQSTLRVDVAVLSAGVSTANQHWGPAGEHPLLLGSNAPGFLHAFLGTSAPVDLLVGHVHGRLVWGRLDQSRFSPVQEGEDRRFMSGMIGVFSPRGVEGLEVGIARFFHSTWPEQGPGAADFLTPLQAFLKENVGGDPDARPENQLASAFFRWVLPRGGVEVYGEYGRDDHSADLRDMLLEPDHISAYLVGFQKTWSPSGSRLVALRGEVLNSRMSHLAHIRPQAPFGKHGQVRQGHTQRGQFLGSAAAFGGGGSLLAIDYYRPGGRWTFAWEGTRLDARLPPAEADVLHALGVESLFLAGRLQLTAGLTGVYRLSGSDRPDQANLNLRIQIRAGI